MICVTGVSSAWRASCALTVTRRSRPERRSRPFASASLSSSRAKAEPISIFSCSARPSLISRPCSRFTWATIAITDGSNSTIPWPRA